MCSESTTAHDTAVELHNCLACLLLVNKMLQKVPIRQRLGLPCGSSAPGCNGNVTSESDAVLGNMFDEVAISSDTVPVTTVTHSPSSSVITERLQEPVLLSNFVSITLTSWHILARGRYELLVLWRFSSVFMHHKSAASDDTFYVLIVREDTLGRYLRQWNIVLIFYTCRFILLTLVYASSMYVNHYCVNRLN